MMHNHLLDRLRQGNPAYGLLLTMGSSTLAEEAAQADFDWIAVDTQHGYFSHEALLGTVQVLGASQATPIARVAGNEFSRIGQLLDIGFMGIIVPLVNTPEEAAQAAAAVRYPPQGRRSAGGSRLLLQSPDYFAQANPFVFLAVMLETREAVRNAEAILQVPGVDCAYIGTGDLALDIGSQTDPRHEEAIQHVITVGQRVGKPTGMACGDPAVAGIRARQGMQFLDVGSDYGLIKNGIRDLQAQLSEQGA